MLTVSVLETLQRGKRVQDLQTTLPIESVVKDRYSVEDLLGKGGFGAVYRVRDQRVKGNLFALKEVINPNKEERERFAFECEVLKRLDHPALPRVYRVFEDTTKARVYMLMDYVAGPNLEILRQRQPEKRFSFADVLKIMAPIVDAVSYLHMQEPPIIHRDIKPANIIVPDGDDDAVLVDFGIAKEYEQDATTTAVRRCSPGYGAPEQYAHGTSPRTDIYGLAATFYALLTGVIPADALYRLTQMASKNMDPLESVTDLAPHVPQHAADAIHRALVLNSSERFPTVEEFWQALSAQAAVVDVVNVEHGASSIAAPSVAIVPVASAKKSLASVGHATPPSVEVVRSAEAARKRRRNVFPIVFALIVLFATLSGVVLDTNVLKGQQVTHAAPTNTQQLKATVTVPAVTTTRAAKPTVAATATTAAVATTVSTIVPVRSTVGTTPPANPTVAPPVTSTYPVLGKTYNGQLTNTFVTPNLTTSIQLTNIVQNNGTITSGYLYINPNTGLAGSGNFTGNVFTNNTISFTVPEYGILPIRFTGTINADRSMNGQYYPVNADGSRNYTQGSGFWSTNPPAA